MTTEAKWLRVNKSNPCPVCGKPDWCEISIDGTAVLCARIQSDQPAGNKGAGWIHKLTADSKSLPLPLKLETVKQSPMASVNRRHEVYIALLNELHLTDYHWEKLNRRGLTDAQITELNYKSLPLERHDIVKSLIESGLKLSGVPGFWLDDSEIRLAGQTGILIPVRNLDKAVIGLQIRCDDI
jgi:hypothetical protein